MEGGFTTEENSLVTMGKRGVAAPAAVSGDDDLDLGNARGAGMTLQDTKHSS